MTVDEMVDFIVDVINKPEKFDDDFCNKYCPLRRSGVCSVESCPYETSFPETLKFWLENEA